MEEKIIGGLFLILIGVLLFLSQMNILALSYFHFTLIFGIFFLLLYLFQKLWFLLLPGIIFFGIGIIILFNLGIFIFMYPIIIGFSFLAVFLTEKDFGKWAVIPAVILLLVGLSGLFNHFFGKSLLGAIVILAGIYLLLKNEF